MKTKQQVVSEFRRAEILDAARTVFARRGFAHGIIDEIAQEAGIAKGTVYLYFSSKTEIYKAVLDHDMKLLKQSTMERIEAAATLRDKIRNFALVRMENAEERKEFFRIMDSEQGNLTMTRSQYRDFLQEPVKRMAEAIEDAVQQEEIRAVPAGKIAWMIADLTRGTIQRRLLGHGEGTLAEEAEFLSGFIWAAIKKD
jgi:TetR/AcrR family fatty acid metabolism transcriptional regulator